MTIAEFAAKHGVKFIRKDASRLHRLIGWFMMLFGYDYMNRAWTTIGRTVAYPVWGPSRPSPDKAGSLSTLATFLEINSVTVRHEFEHVKQYLRLWHLHSFLYFFSPLPVALSPYRAWAELVAYAPAVADGVRDLEATIDTVAKVYFYPLPKWLMRRWLTRMVERLDVH